MSRDWRLRARDIIEAAERGIEFAGDLDPESFKANREKQAAVLYRVVIIGEAMSRLPAEILARLAGIAWEEVIGMRNIVVHGYFHVDPNIVWKTARNDLVPIRDAMRSLLDDPRPER